MSLKSRYIIKRPKLQASKNIQKIMYRLKETSKKNFTKKLDEWYKIYKLFTEEKSINSDTNKYHFTHYKVKEHTNILDSETFKPMKSLLNMHIGFTKSLKLKIVYEYLINHNKI